MYKLVMVRQGESLFSKDGRFCGWHDSDLADVGVETAKKAALMLLDKNILPEKAYTSVLKRAIKTLFYIQESMDRHWIPVVRDWRLNERMCGALTGLHKAECALKYGVDQVKIWRRSYDLAPPPIEENSEFSPKYDLKYKSLGFKEKDFPEGESLMDVEIRLMPWINEDLRPNLRKGLTIMIVAHGSTIRALVKYFEGLSGEEIFDVEIPMGIPLVYELDKYFKVTKQFYATDPVTLEAAINHVKELPPLPV